MNRKAIPRPSQRNKYLDQIYLVPSDGPFDAVYFHADIPEINGAQCRRELERVRLRLLQDSRPSPWLLDRFDALAERVQSDAN